MSIQFLNFEQTVRKMVCFLITTFSLTKIKFIFLHLTKEALLRKGSWHIKRTIMPVVQKFLLKADRTEDNETWWILTSISALYFKVIFYCFIKEHYILKLHWDISALPKMSNFPRSSLKKKAIRNFSLALLQWRMLSATLLLKKNIALFELLYFKCDHLAPWLCHCHWAENQLRVVRNNCA